MTDLDDLRAAVQARKAAVAADQATSKSCATNWPRPPGMRPRLYTPVAAAGLALPPTKPLWPPHSHSWISSWPTR